MAKNFRDYNFNDWDAYYWALNVEKPLEECGLDLDEEGRSAYAKSLKHLIDERKKHPGIPINYEVKYGDVE